MSGLQFAREYLASLSAEQDEAARHFDSPVNLIACAGSGKTRSMIARFIRLVLPVIHGGKGADPASIMLVTFTNKTAREIQERLAPVMEALREMGVHGRPWIGTMHGISLRILRIEGRHANLGSNFTILDEDDAAKVAEGVAEELDVSPFDIDEFFEDLSFVKANLIRHEVLLNRMKAVEEAGEARAAEDRFLRPWLKLSRRIRSNRFAEVYNAYQGALEQQNSVDFSDLLNKVTYLLRSNEAIRHAWQANFRHLMVDEFQDVNLAQRDWLSTIFNCGRAAEIGPDANWSDTADATHGDGSVSRQRMEKWPVPTIFFVGDDDQGIYGFNGASHDTILSIEKIFTGTQVKFLQESYRCPPSVLSCANRLVSVNTRRFSKTIVPADPGRADTPVVARQFPSFNDEIEAIGNEVRAHVMADGQASDFAVLCRTRNAARFVARGLRARGLPVLEGRSSDLRKASEVKDLMSMATYMVNPGAEIALRRMIAAAGDKMGKASLAQVSENARIKRVPFAEEMVSVMRDRIDLPPDAKPYGKAFRRAAQAFAVMVDDMRVQARDAPDAGKALLRILEISGYLDTLKMKALKSIGLDARAGEMMALPPRDFLVAVMSASDTRRTTTVSGGEEVPDDDLETLSDDSGRLSDAVRRVGNIAMFVEEASHAATLNDFVQESSLEMSAHTAAAGVHVMTMHASKGLEFNHVRVPFVNEGIMPSVRKDDDPADLEEERRLFYVAMTRSRQSFRCSFAARLENTTFYRGGPGRGRKSPFIEEMELKDTPDIAVYREDGRRIGLSRGAGFRDADFTRPAGWDGFLSRESGAREAAIEERRAVLAALPPQAPVEHPGRPAETGMRPPEDGDPGAMPDDLVPDYGMDMDPGMSGLPDPEYRNADAPAPGPDMQDALPF